MARFASFASVFLPCVGMLVLAGCPSTDKDNSADDSADSGVPVDTYSAPADNDGDGQSEADGDCDDNDATVFLGQVESCDGLDNNCNDIADEGFADSDGNGTPDCRDVEVCDGVDNNGDGVIDEGFDADGDGYTTCGSRSAAADCDDTNAAVHPGQGETDGNNIDDNCDGVIDVTTWHEGDLIITEVLYNPQSVIDPYGEWIEVYNTTRQTLNANGLQFVSSDGSSFTVVSSEALPIEPGGYFVFGIDGDTSENGDVEVGYVYSGYSLNNEGDDLTLYGDGTMLDYLYWDDGATMPQAIGASLMVDPLFYGDSNPDYWCAATHVWGTTSTGDKGSPGGVNEPCSSWDHDGDGYSGDTGDCDDTNTDIYPGAYSPDSTADWDCDGILNSGPTAVATATGGYSCDPIQLDGSRSTDPDGDTLSYSWTLVSAPSGSAKTTASINTTTSASPTLATDTPGTYTFSLTVSDGVIVSAPTSVSIDVASRPTNSAPVASAGADQTQTGTADCTPISYGTGGYDCNDCTAVTYSLSASASSDADGDEMTYGWAISSGSGYASLSVSSGASTIVSVSGVTATYGSATVQDVIVTLTVSDCMGASSTDDVQLEMQCTGY